MAWFVRLSLFLSRSVGGLVDVWVDLCVFLRICVEIITGGGGKQETWSSAHAPCSSSTQLPRGVFFSSEVMHWDCSLSFACLLFVRSESEKGTWCIEPFHEPDSLVLCACGDRWNRLRPVKRQLRHACYPLSSITKGPLFVEKIMVILYHGYPHLHLASSSSTPHARRFWQKKAFGKKPRSFTSG